MSEESKLEKLLIKLTQEGGETNKILHTAERLLSLKPNHVMALKCKVVCCMHNDKYGAAITVLDRLGEVDPRGTGTSLPLRFQRAYCLYRMQRYADAKVLLAHELVKHHIPSQNLSAQVFYNLEDYSAAAAVYENLLATGGFRDEQEKMELMVNYTAALSACNPKKALAVARESEERSCDMFCNMATALIEAQDYAGALKALQQAESLCAKEHPASSVKSVSNALALSEVERENLLGQHVNTSSSERKFFNEVVNTWTQMAFVHYAMKNEKLAEEMLLLILACKPNSVVTSALASVNLTAIRRHGDFFDSARRLKSSQNARVAARLTSKQLLIVRYNAALLHLNAGNLLSCRKQVDQLVKDFPESDLARSLKLALAARENKKKRQSNESLVAELGSSGPSSAGGKQASMQLVVAQILLEQGDLQGAVKALESDALAHVADQPAGVLTRAAWLVQLGNCEAAIQRIESAVLRLNNMQTAKSMLVWAVHYLTTNLPVALNGGEKNGYELAAALLQKVRKGNAELEKDADLTALLALCLARVDAKAARACMASIQGASPATAAVNAKELESKQPSRAAMEALGYRRATALDGEKGGKQLRGRRPRPMRRRPKNVEGRPDPERWIPISIRSYIKDLPERRKKDLRRLRAQEQEHKRRAAEKRKAEAAAQ